MVQNARIPNLCRQKNGPLHLSRLFFRGHHGPVKRKQRSSPGPDRERLPLQRGQVIRLGKDLKIRGIQLMSGRIWLTGTPARGDLILSGGERLELSDDWPFVVEALEPAELLLLRNEGIPHAAESRETPAIGPALPRPAFWTSILRS